MLSIGEQLYRLTQRDEETLLVDPYFRTGVFILTPAVSAGIFDFPVQPDRCFYLHSFQWRGNAETATVWVQFAVQILDKDRNVLNTVYEENTTGGLSSDGGNPATLGSNVIVQKNRRLDLLCPAGVSFIRFISTRGGTTGSVAQIATLNGYQIPPGRFGRF